MGGREGFGPYSARTLAAALCLGGAGGFHPGSAAGAGTVPPSPGTRRAARHPVPPWCGTPKSHPCYAHCQRPSGEAPARAGGGTGPLVSSHGGRAALGGLRQNVTGDVSCFAYSLRIFCSLTLRQNFPLLGPPQTHLLRMPLGMEHTITNSIWLTPQTEGISQVFLCPLHQSKAVWMVRRAGPAHSTLLIYWQDFSKRDILSPVRAAVLPPFPCRCPARPACPPPESRRLLPRSAPWRCHDGTRRARQRQRVLWSLRFST